MDMDAREAIDEGFNEVNKQQEENKRAEEEAAKDLGIEPEDSHSYDQKFGGDTSSNDDYETPKKDHDIEYTANRISTHDTLNDLMHHNSV